jgi:Na+/H+ antiporter NhaD/arsenite permease-like protein
MNNTMMSYFLAAVVLLAPGMSLASEAPAAGQPVDFTSSGVGLFAIAVFLLAYLLVMAEEFTHLRKSKPVILAAGIIWGAIAWVAAQHGLSTEAEHAVRHNLLEYAELMLFLLVAMTYINAMEERRVFEALRAWLVASGFGFRALFWITGVLAFLISPIADNLTTALLMCAVVMAVGGDNSRFVGIACINIVVAANAGGAFSPFGDITTLMVWQKGMVAFWDFFALFIPSAVNFLVPAAIMHFAIPDLKPDASSEQLRMQRGAKRIIALFLLTIFTAVSFHNFLHMPPVIGMLTGLAYLQFFGFYLKKTALKDLLGRPDNAEHDDDLGSPVPFDVFKPVARAVMYNQWGATYANVAVGLLSAVVDNIPVMFAVLTMNPDMSVGQWLLVTLTAGVGGSLLSIGSAAGVALMGQARGKYTFFGHLKWTPVIALGYGASIYVHMLVNAAHFSS